MSPAYCPKRAAIGSSTPATLGRISGLDNGWMLIKWVWFFWKYCIQLFQKQEFKQNRHSWILGFKNDHIFWNTKELKENIQLSQIYNFFVDNLSDNTIFCGRGGHDYCLYCVLVLLSHSNKNVSKSSQHKDKNPRWQFSPQSFYKVKKKCKCVTKNLIFTTKIDLWQTNHPKKVLKNRFTGSSLKTKNSRLKQLQLKLHAHCLIC